MRIRLYDCPKCPRKNLLLNEVVLQPRGNIWMCKICNKEYRKSISKKYYENPERKKHVSDFYKFRRYGLNRELFNKKLELQLNGCAICKQEFKLERNIYIDHNHKTKLTRDLLCPRCNNVLGLVNDNEELLWEFLNYLKRHTKEGVA